MLNPVTNLTFYRIWVSHKVPVLTIVAIAQDILHFRICCQSRLSISVTYIAAVLSCAILASLQAVRAAEANCLLHFCDQHKTWLTVLYTWFLIQGPEYDVSIPHKTCSVCSCNCLCQQLLWLSMQALMCLLCADCSWPSSSHQTHCVCLWLKWTDVGITSRLARSTMERPSTHGTSPSLSVSLNTARTMTSPGMRQTGTLLCLSTSCPWSYLLTLALVYLSTYIASSPSFIGSVSSVSKFSGSTWIVLFTLIQPPALLKVLALHKIISIIYCIYVIEFCSGHIRCAVMFVLW